MTAFSQYLTIEEETEIHQQFNSTWRQNNQVMWSSILREHAQAWANEHDMSTLTTAMGPLMASEDSRCLRRQKSTAGRSKYVKGASAIFAWHISKGESVIVLSPPPPERFHPSGKTNYQAIEEPILKREKEGGGRLRLEMVHPMVKGAEDFSYQIWPIDQTYDWVGRFGLISPGVRCWRSVKGISQKSKTKDNSNCDVEDEVIIHEEKSDPNRKALLLREEIVPKKQEALKEQAACKEMKALRKQVAMEEQVALEEKKALKKRVALKNQAGLVEEKEALRKRVALEEIKAQQKRVVKVG
ncbi:uncharacterized protein RAG0_12561 [Rhynchosporium agropyri]|uniref:Uncharacterized protein n=1 Tax=Rhynchosporium agropyri TaxID=914238 RepID=A0A1E1L913_9HELO|nr:uncharacterized protein RAG0_12561 [Rhynchosporium agropyri]